MSDIFLAERNRMRPRQAPSSRYAEIIPPGVNVLVVDANEVSLVITEAKLCHFGYTVFTVGGIAEAASMVDDRSINIHLVLAEARLPGSEKFEILDKLGRRSDVAVVNDEDKDAMLEALKRGAFFYLVKPIPTVIATKLWQIAMVKKREGYTAGLAEKSGVDLASALKEKEPEKDEKTRGSSKATAAGKTDGRKRRDGKKEKNKEGNGDNPAEKETRPKLAWTLELHKRFLQAMEVLGPDRAHPKGILQQMDIPGLRKEHISSHLQQCHEYTERTILPNFAEEHGAFLQKYRIYLKNKEKLAAEKGIMSLAASGIVPAYHPSSSSAVAGEAPGVIPLSLGVSSSWAVTPIIGGAGPWTVQSSSSSAGVTQLGAIDPSMANSGLSKWFHKSGVSLQANLHTMGSLRNELNIYNLPASFNRGIWMKCHGMTGRPLPGSLNSDRHAYWTEDNGRTTATPSTEEVEEKPRLPLLPRQPDHPGFN